MSKRDAKAETEKKRREGKNLGGRPLKPIDPDQVYRLALIHCTAEEIAAVLDCVPSVIYDRFSDILHKGHKEGQMSMKRKMHEVAMNGDVKMLIWLSKQRLGYKDTIPEREGQTTITVNVTEVPEMKMLD